MVSVELLETVADLLSEIPAGPGGEARGVVERPGVGVGGGGELGGQPGGYSIVLSLAYQHVLTRCYILRSQREREQNQAHLVHVKIGVDPLLLQSSHNLSQDVNVGLVNL